GQHYSWTWTTSSPRVSQGKQHTQRFGGDQVLGESFLHASALPNALALKVRFPTSIWRFKSATPKVVNGSVSDEKRRSAPEKRRECLEMAQPSGLGTGKSDPFQTFPSIVAKGSNFSHSRHS
ncbi:hypothetical protein, partial [Mesorhizobium sp. M1322]|uniref:hypothetical protein n=1 Tax=Mesorhizobium sp. M1322 TaxID=2957081 RepID=UPI00333956B9